MTKMMMKRGDIVRVLDGRQVEVKTSTGKVVTISRPEKLQKVNEAQSS